MSLNRSTRTRRRNPADIQPGDTYWFEGTPQLIGEATHYVYGTAITVIRPDRTSWSTTVKDHNIHRLLITARDDSDPVATWSCPTCHGTRYVVHGFDAHYPQHISPFPGTTGLRYVCTDLSCAYMSYVPDPTPTPETDLP
jgi:hypothetical protein